MRPFGEYIDAPPWRKGELDTSSYRPRSMIRASAERTG